MADPEAVAHTAEHVFMRALTERIDIRPRLVQHEGWSGRIEVIGEEPTWEAISEAMSEANRVIMEGRRIFEFEFSSLEEAKSRFPGLRAYEERITPPVRVVEVEGYDWAACSRRHAQNTSEAWAIVIDRASNLSKGRYELRFHTGPAASERISILAREAASSARLLNSGVDSLSSAVTALMVRADEVRGRARALERALLRGQGVELALTSSGAPLMIVRADGLDPRDVMEDAIEAASSAGRCILAISCLGSTSDPSCQVLLACPRGSAYNAGAVFRAVISTVNGKGGGGKEAAAGSVDRARLEVLLEGLKRAL